MLAPGNAGTFKTLTVEGNYAGGGTLTLNTALGSDNSATDKLIVEGNTSGHTRVAINNIGGMGAQTVEGIEIVNVAGASDGTFEKESRIVAGAYDYDVVRRGSNWYLSSAMEPADPTDPVDQTDPNGPSDPGCLTRNPANASAPKRSITNSPRIRQLSGKRPGGTESGCGRTTYFSIDRLGKCLRTNGERQLSQRAGNGGREIQLVNGRGRSRGNLLLIHSGLTGLCSRK